MIKTLVFGVAAIAFCASAFAQDKDLGHVPPSFPSPIKFKKVVINANSDFEAASAADINGDGKLDIVCGDTWYEAPNWTPHKFREIGVWGRGPDSSGYRGDFADLPVDVNGDGKIDIVSSDYSTGELFWHENPGKSDALWQRHEIAKPGSSETTRLIPLLGKKSVCVLPNCGNQVVWYELRTRSASPQWVEHPVGKEGAGHGIGWGDVNGDGKLDLICPNGWYENVDALNDKWIWHPDFHCKPGDLGIGTPTMDFYGDGRNAIVFGSGHHYGLYVLRQNGTVSQEKWTQETIDGSFSQAHAVDLVDLEGTRHPVILTGKRYLAHDHDVGAREPRCLYYYKYNRKAKHWERYVIDEGTEVGTGLQLTEIDLRKTGRLDIIAPGKSGLFLFENEGRR